MNDIKTFIISKDLMRREALGNIMSFMNLKERKEVLRSVRFCEMAKRRFTIIQKMQRLFLSNLIRGLYA